jgi:hypothetical protein
METAGWNSCNRPGGIAAQSIGDQPFTLEKEIGFNLAGPWQTPRYINHPLHLMPASRQKVRPKALA